MKNRIVASDLFCGAGGTSLGMIQAFQAAGFEVELTAINHWDVAVATHSANHPKARHLCASLDALNPRDLFKPGELDALWGSPECIEHSIARGGKPITEQGRATAFCMTRWAEALRPPVIWIENVRQFLDWGPIGSNGRPLKSRRGEIFRQWVKMFEAIGYRVEYRILCAADYGDPTTRERLFIQCVLGRRKIVWPEPTHAPQEQMKDLFGDTRQPWVAAREVIEWDLKGQSIFTRKRPLSPTTLNRILYGLRKFGVKPFIVPQHRGFGNTMVDSIERPLRSITTTSRGVGLADPFLIECAHGDKTDKDSKRRVHSLDKPLGTIMTSNRFALCEPFVVAFDHTGGNGNQVRPVSQPLSSITTKQRHALCEPFDTITTKERFGLAMPVLEVQGKKYLLDVLFRMITPKELARGQGFPDNYTFTGTKTEKVKQIGNAVPAHLARALVSAGMENFK